MTDTSLPHPPNTQAELARARNRASAERTLMAWIRTSLSLISFGFGIDSIVSAIRSFQDTEALDPVRFSRVFGLAFITLGIYAIIMAAIEHRREIQHIQRHADYLYIPHRSLGWTVALALIAIGSLAFVGVLF